jgi:drug/metabolite transporter (DMT)-like permease
MARANPLGTGAACSADAPPTAEIRVHPLVYAGLLGVVIAWGGSFVAADALLRPAISGQTSLSPTVLAATRFSLAALCFVPPLARAILRRQVASGDLLRMAILGQITCTLYRRIRRTTSCRFLAS